MASPSHSRLPSAGKASDDKDDLMKEIDRYKPDFKDMVERSLTNLNVHMASVAEQLEELTKSYQEFSANFLKQQELLSQELKMLRIDSSMLRKEIAEYVEDQSAGGEDDDEE